MKLLGPNFLAREIYCVSICRLILEFCSFKPFSKYQRLSAYCSLVSFVSIASCHFVIIFFYICGGWGGGKGGNGEMSMIYQISWILTELTLNGHEYLLTTHSSIEMSKKKLVFDGEFHIIIPDVCPSLRFLLYYG